MRHTLSALFLFACSQPLSPTVDQVDSVDTTATVSPNQNRGIASPAPVSPAPTAPSAACTPVAFPGAEGFGACASGGRGGKVIHVTNLNSAGPGSLRDAVAQTGARTVVFDVSGVITGDLQIASGDLTIAGQSSPGGITLDGGILCDNIYDPNDCNNVILRHLRVRNRYDDGVRIGGSERFMVDHLSVELAHDESFEISRSHNVTVQHSIIAEPTGDHFWAGILINYSAVETPLDNITLHHNVWNGVQGRMPEISCEENGDAPSASNCAGRTLHVEISNNVFYDVRDPSWYNRCVGTNEGNDCAPSANDFLLNLNYVSNVMYKRGAYNDALFVNDFSRSPQNAAYWSDNVIFSGATQSVGTLPVVSRASRFDLPAITLQPAATLVAQLQRTAGAFPRDAMDTRVMGYLSLPVEQRPAAWTEEGEYIEHGDGFTVSAAPAPPTDSDNDGMPDDWESAAGLKPTEDDHNGTGLSLARTGAAGYTNLEVYLNELAASRIP